jgi:AbiV family abortive infection protein
MSMKSNGASPDLFTGALSPADAIAGVRLLQANAMRLVEDAKILLQAERYPSAAMVAVMALDEMSRIFHPLTIAAISGPGRLAEGWKAFRSNRRDFPWSAFHREGDRHDMRPMTDAELGQMLSLIRRLGRETDCVGPGRWIDPEGLISRDLAAAVVGTAELFCRNRTGARSMELWIEATGALPQNASVMEILKTYRDLLESEGLADAASAIGNIRLQPDRATKRFGGEAGL